MDTSKTTITLANYENLTSDKLASQINGASGKINSISPNSVPQELKGSSSKAELYLFSDIPETIGKETTFNARIIHYFTYGKDDKTKMTSYSGDDAKKKIEAMIGFCEGYSKMYDKVASDLDKLSKNAADKQMAILDVLGEKNTNESTMFEANQNEVVQDGSSKSVNSDDKEKFRSSTVITSVIRDYTAAVLTVLEKKYLDYIKVLNKLAPKDNNKPAESANEDENTNNEENK